MNVLQGPRRETRRVIHKGTTYWVSAEGSDLTLPDGQVVHESAVTHLPPCEPTKIVCVHLNYTSRFYEFRNQRYDPASGLTPTYFMKPTTSLNGHGGEVLRPQGCQFLNYEGEIAMVVGKVTRNITPEQAWDHIAGFAPALDMGMQDMRDTDAGSMLRVKGMDGFCPIGPGLVAGVDVRQSTLTTTRNGTVVQQANLADELMWGFDYLLADLARYMTFLPGDIIMTGTPANSRPLDIGDEIAVEVSGLGRIACTIAESNDPKAQAGHMPTASSEVTRVALGCDARLPAGISPYQAAATAN